MDIDDYDTDDYYNQDVYPPRSLSSKYAERRTKNSSNRGFLDGKVSFLKRSPSSTSWPPLTSCSGRKNGFLDGQDFSHSGGESKRQKHEHQSSKVQNSDEEEDPTTSSCGLAPKRKRIQVKRSGAGERRSGEKRVSADPAINPNPPPELEEAIGKMGGMAVNFVTQKKLFVTDIRSGQNRFPIPLLSETFLNIDERDQFYNEENGERYVMMVPFMDIKGKIWELSLRKWKKFFALATSWHSMLTDNGLEPDDCVQLWSFRVQAQLWFAMVKVLSPEQNAE